MSTDLIKRYNEEKKKLFEKAYSFLNKEQREAVFTVNGPLLVLAGAGSGKTTVLVHRIAFIVRYGNAYYNEITNVSESDLEDIKRASVLTGDDLYSCLDRFAYGRCPSWAVLAITFTNKAANEMKERLAKTLGEDGGANDIWAGTFHSVCVRILRRFGENIGVGSNFTIYDTEDTRKLTATILKDLNIDEKMFPVKSVVNSISKCKEKLLAPDEVPVSNNDYRMTRLVRIYKEYQSRLEASNALDFDDIIMKTVELLKSSDEARDYYQRRFKYVCVDEYQDTNHAQFELTRLLSDGYRNLMVVGDDDQSIYKFRGATIKNILEFDTVYSDAKVIKLEQNYRSTQNILDAANAIIKNNAGRKGKELWTSNGEGSKITVKKLEDQNAEASYIADSILKQVREDNRKYSDFAILYRMNAQSNALEKVLSKSGVPYRVLGGMRFYDRKEIKDIIAYLCLINNSGDDLRLTRIINEPKRKIGAATIDAVAKIAAAEGCSMFEVIAKADRYTALSKSARSLLDFAELINKLKKISETETLSYLFEQTCELSGYKHMLIEGGEEEYERLQNVEELISNAVDYEKDNEDATLQGFLEEVALVSDIDNYDKDDDAVVLMTIHSAKGLEFPVVYLPGMENGIFPGQQNQLDPEEMEEERRLAYVAVTRAKQKLFCTHVRERLMFGKTQYNQISQFITEMPSSRLDMVDETRHRNFTFETTSAYDKKKDAIAKGIGAPSVFTTPRPQTSQNRFEAGQDVIHPTFGEGTVLTVKPMGSDFLYEIAFENVGTKKLMGSYAKLKEKK